MIVLFSGTGFSDGFLVLGAGIGACGIMILSSYCWTISFTDLRGAGTGLYVLGVGTGLVSSTIMFFGLCCFNSKLISSDLLSFLRLALSIFIRLDIFDIILYYI